MSVQSPLPTYQDNLPLFVSQLRGYLCLSQQELAARLHVDRSRISRYENLYATDTPKLDYLAALAHLIATETDHQPIIQQSLLQAVNAATRVHYRKRPFQTWQALERTARQYLKSQQRRHASRQAKKPAPAAAISPDWQAMLEARLEAPSYSKLIGLETELEQLEATLCRPAQPRLIFVEGLGGTGKTSLVNVLVRKPQLSERFQGILWVSLHRLGFTSDSSTNRTDHPAPAIDPVVDALLSQLDQTIPSSLPLNQKLALLGNRLEKEPYLLVIDNVETAAEGEILQPYLPNWAGPGKIIVTSRYHFPENGATCSIQLQGLKKAAAIQLITHEAQLRGSTVLAGVTPEHLNHIFSVVGGHPLALKLIVGHLAILPFSQVLDNLKSLRDQEVDALYAAIYRQTWSLLNQAARQTLLIMRLAQGGTLPQLRAVSQLELPDLNQVLRTLAQVSLLEVRGSLDERRYRIHQLTETFLTKVMGEAMTPSLIDLQQCQQYFRAGIQRNVDYWQAWLEANTTTPDAVKREHALVLRAITFALPDQATWKATYDLITTLSPYMERWGYWQPWSHIVTQAIITAQRIDDLAKGANLSVTLALMLQRQGKLKEGVAHYRRAIRDARRAGNQFTEARACTNLGYLYIELGQWWRSKILCCSALSLFEAINNHYGSAHTLNHLGILYSRQETWDKARTYLTRACVMFRENDDKHGLMRGYINFSIIYIETGALDEAISYLQQALALAEQSGEQAELGTIYMNLGYAYRLQNNLTQAETYALQAETIFQQNSNLPGLARVRDNLGMVYRHQGEWQKAVSCLERALHTWRVLGNRGGEVETLIDLIDCQLAGGNHAQATAHLNEVAELIGSDFQGTPYEQYRLRLKEYHRSLFGKPSAP